MPFLELRTPRDMLEKAKRDYAKLIRENNVDHVFNFFVTAYHIRDYVEKTTGVGQQIINDFCEDQDIRDCRDLCDKAKHLRLTRRADPITHKWSGTFNGAPFNTVPIGGDGRWELWSDGRNIDINSLAGRVIQKWEGFFEINRL